MKGGTSQNERTTASPKNVPFLVDERSILDMVLFTLQYSKKIKYFNLQNIPNGTWTPFFLNDPVFIVALIADAETQRFKVLNDSLQYKLSESTEDRKSELEEEIAENILELASYLYKWLNLFEDAGYSGPLLNEIRDILNYLKTEIVSVLPFQKKFHPANFRIWESIEMEDRSNVHFSEIFKSVYKSILFFKEKASGRFKHELVENNRQAPHVGLLLAFFKLFQELQTDINRFTGKHLDFYYKTLLAQKERPPQPSTAIIGLNPNAPAEEVFVPAGQKTRLTFSNKKELDFVTLFDGFAGTASISEVRTLFQSEFAPFADSGTEKDVFLNNIYDTTLYTGEKLKQIGFADKSIHESPPIMGEDQHNKGAASRTMWESDIGLAISSPVLIIEKGKVKVSATLTLSEASMKLFLNQLTALQNLKKNTSATAGKSENDERERNAFVRTFLGEAFRLYYTGATDWVVINSFYIDFREDIHTLKISFDLTPEEEQPHSFIKEVHRGNFNTDWPLLKILLNNEAPLPPYRPLKDLEVTDISVRVNVEQVEKLSLSNQLGELDSENSFQPFGPLPAQGSFLKMRSPFIFHKYLSSLDIHLKWNGVPREKLGFKSYYSAYPYDYENESFVGGISVTRGKQPVEVKGHTQEFRLFDMKQSNGLYLSPYKTVKVNLEIFNVEKGPGLTTEERAENDLALLITIKEPFHAFGHHVFSELFASHSIKNSRFKKGDAALPKQPYTPVLEHILVDYKNTAKENLSRGSAGKEPTVKLFHIYPFGHVLAYPSSLESFSFLLPQISHKGNLFIGLEDVHPNQHINLGFELEPAVLPVTSIHPPHLRWSYLDKNRWLPLANLLMEDSTAGFLHSGVVKIKIPPSPDKGNTKLAKGKFWLRVAYRGQTDLSTKIKQLFTNAFKIVSTNPFHCEYGDSGPLIKVEKLNLMGGNPNLSPFGPFQLDLVQNRRNEDQLYISTNERLRHKDRASSTWDFERLILDRFPQIGRVLVYGRSSFPHKLIKGNKVQVVVIPKGDPLQKVPFVTLKTIKAYISGKASSYATFEVSGPVVERLKVRCRVRFSTPEQSGYFRDLLNRELVDYLSGTTPLQQESGFLQSIYKSEILNFIENRDYVEFVTSFSVLQIVEVQGAYNIIDTAVKRKRGDIERLRTISPYAILSSVPEHQIKILYDEVPREPERASIGDLSIDSDFVVKKQGWNT